MSAGPLRVPISAASSKGVSWLAETAGERRVVLTKFGRAVAVVDAAESVDEQARAIGAAAREVVEAYADLAADRAGAGRSLDDVCAKLGINADRVRSRAAELADRPT